MNMHEIEAFSLPRGEVQFDGDHLCLHFVRSGSAFGLRKGHRHPIVEDVYLIQNLGTKHSIAAESTRVNTICLPRALVGDERFAESSTPHDLHVDRAISHFAEALRYGDRSDRHHWGAEITRALVHARDTSNQNFFLKPSDRERRRDEMKLAREYVLARLHLPLTVPEIADHCALSPFHFHRVFAEWHGMTPGQYILTEKVRRACRKLVLTNEPVAAIAAACGFLSSTSFAGMFKASTGFSPSAFREMAAKHRSDLKFFLA